MNPMLASLRNHQMFY